jgi:hypothetical protein
MLRLSEAKMNTLPTARDVNSCCCALMMGDADCLANRRDCKAMRVLMRPNTTCAATLM